VKYILTFLAYFLVLIPVQSQNYAKIFDTDYKDAINYFKTNKATLSNGFRAYNIDLELASSTVFPERIRYSIVKDFFETAYLEVFYVENGSDEVDFSIGDFQIKPSFAEKVEFVVKYNPILKNKYTKLLYNNKLNIKQIRTTRVKRLKNLEYQIIYISAFCDIVKIKFRIENMPKNEKIKFYATAYNFGFDKSEKTIKNHINDMFFPYGGKYPGKQYSYSNISVYFYKSNFYSIFNAK